MKKIITLAAISLITLGSCTKLDVKIEAQPTSENFPVTEDDLLAATGTIYKKFTGSFGVDIWRMGELSTDEAIITARNGGYYDQGRYLTLHKHTWTPAHDIVKTAWEWGYGGISDCNRVLNLLENAPDSEIKTSFVREVRTMRALFYFYMMDMFGNVPITSFGTAEQPKQSTRTEVFKFIESELLAVAEQLPAPATVEQKYYGHPTKWMAYALLQKMYLNAEYYTGTAMYAQSLTYADKIMTGSKMSLVANYNDLFAANNGPNSETIFSAVYDANYSPGNAMTRFTLHSTLRAKYGLPFSPSNAMCTIAEFYNTFNLPDDKRNSLWLAGIQYSGDGKAIANGSGSLNFTPEIVLTDEATMDVGPEIGGVSRGVRSVKFYPDPNTNASTRFQNNDMPIFRLADVHLMKAEALLRSGGDVGTALKLVNDIRLRSGVRVALTSLTLDDLLLERGRELAWEGWRRNDLIRFGKYEGKWGFKAGNESVNRRIFPIPATELVLNSNLVQNTGY